MADPTDVNLRKTLWRHSLAMLAILTFVSTAMAQSTMRTPSTRVVKETLAWEELSGRLDGQNVAIGRTSGAIVYGVVDAVTPDTIRFRKRNRNLPGGGNELPKAEVSVIQYDGHRGNSRKWWSLGMALAGAGGAVALGAMEVGGENGQAFVPMALGLSAGGATGGYLVGRERDRTTYVISLRRKCPEFCVNSRSLSQRFLVLPLYEEVSSA
jgi:hypothetical protein